MPLLKTYFQDNFMDSLLFLIPIALGLGLLGLGAFFWTVRTAQYDDLEGAAHRILIKDDE